MTSLSRDTSLASVSNKSPKEDLKGIAAETLDALKNGSPHLQQDLTGPVALSEEATRYYAPDSDLAEWQSSASEQSPSSAACKISLCEESTLQGARRIAQEHPGARIGLLNFASATRPGGGFLSGARAQEESIARSSTLFPTLMTDEAQQFYKLHIRDRKGGYYSHAMIYSPDVLLFRGDAGEWLEPLAVDVLTSAAVNAGVVRQRAGERGEDPQHEEEKIARAMEERMGRVLYLLEKQGVRHIVLGSFGTGVFRNNVETVASIWAKLLKEGSRFEKSFDRIVFAIIGRATFEKFEDVSSVELGYIRPG
ncbi:hypothetical protein PsYK624_108820 [Phanerochaete sordida]|uniref:Microbial-type PARG catalytic domain-containing protein n=1 Tax=Phanerochaete sordida TaxID=48140 RepID=A0A9P3GH53_9APHY|nr:hypothetical protein PsYK624_108820 [Phanerochaete sordida]